MAGVLLSCRPSRQHNLRGKCISRSLVGVIDASPVASVPSFVTASAALEFYRKHHSVLRLSETVALLVSVEGLQPSRHDQRLLLLVEQILAQKENLSLTAIINLSQALQGLGLHKELPGLTALAVESASFLPSDAIVSLAKTLCLSIRQAPLAIDSKEYIAVFRILGEHLLEGMANITTNVLGEALLAIASFYCGRHGAGVRLTLSKAWLDDIFTPYAEFLLGRITELPPDVLVKCLRAYKLLNLSKPKSRTSANDGNGPAGHLHNAIAGSLTRNIEELRLKSVVRSLHAMAALSNHGVFVDEEGQIFCNTAVNEIRNGVKSMDVHDISFTMKAIAMLLPRQLASPADVTTLLQALHVEIQHHVPSLMLEDVLAVTKAFVSTSSLEPPGIAMELMGAELLRELRNLKPEQICDTIVACSRLRFKQPSLIEGFSLAVTSQLSRFHPKHLALSLHGLTKLDLRDERMLLQVEKHMVNSLISFQPRDMALSLWAFAKATHRSNNIFAAVQEEINRQDISTMTPADASMFLWSVSKADAEFNADTLGILAHYVVNNIRSFPVEALVVTCLGFARLGFAQQPILIDLYRNLYGKLPLLTDSQLAFSFLLFSTSGIRDEPLVHRFLYESKCRLHKLRAQELGNILLACSRIVSPATLSREHSMSEPLRESMFKLLESNQVPLSPLLDFFLAAPTLLEFSEEDNIRLMGRLEQRFEEMDASELVRCLLATVKLDIVHKPFLLPLFHLLRKNRGYVNSSEVISCIWAVHSLGFCKPKFLRSLAVVLLGHVRRRTIAPRTLRDILPALSELGLWERLPNSLRRSIWKMASDDLRRGVSPPPPARAQTKDDLMPASTSQEKWLKENSARLTPLQPGLLRRGFLKNKHQATNVGVAVVRKSAGWDAIGLKSMKVDTRAQSRIEEQNRKKLDAEASSITGSKNAVQDFVDMIRRL